MLQRDNLLFLSVMLVTFMIGFDTTGLGVAIPEISHQMGFDVKEGSWLSVAYTAGFSAFLLPAGIITDKKGYSSTMLLSLFVFLISSFIVTRCTTLEGFILSRLIHGMSAAFLNTSAMALLNMLYPVGGAKDRAGAFKNWSLFLGLSLAVGPILGSILVSYASWKWILLINIPLAAIVVLPYLSRSTVKLVNSGNLSKVSLLSTLPVTIVLLLLTLGSFIPSLPTIFLASFSVACLFILHFTTVTSFTRLPELRNGKFLLSLTLPIIFSVSYWSLFVDLPGIISLNFHVSALEVMLFMSSMAAPLTLFPVLKIQERLNLDNRAGFIFLSVGLGTLSLFLGEKNSNFVWVLFFSLGLMGCGAALLNPVMARVVMDQVAPENSGLAAAITSTLRQSGFAFGVAYYSLMTMKPTGERVFSLSESQALGYAAALPIVAILICLIISKKLNNHLLK